jgi:hypothetical protein
MLLCAFMPGIKKVLESGQPCPHRWKNYCFSQKKISNFCYCKYVLIHLIDSSVNVNLLENGFYVFTVQSSMSKYASLNPVPFMQDKHIK